MNRNYTAPHVSDDWASTRETSMAVAVAIHAIADSNRSADMIWETPTPAEWDHVTMAVEEYVTNGDFWWQPKFFWGEESISVPEPASSDQ